MQFLSPRRAREDEDKRVFFLHIAFVKIVLPVDELIGAFLFNPGFHVVEKYRSHLNPPVSFGSMASVPSGSSLSMTSAKPGIVGTFCCAAD